MIRIILGSSTARIDTIDNEVVEDILSVYFRLCSIEVDCADLARFGAVLANNGRIVNKKETIIPARHVTIAISMMASSGLYDGSGEPSTVGIPAKTGVSGGIIGVVPGKIGVAAYSPVMDEKGNTYRGQRLLRAVSEAESKHIRMPDLTRGTSKRGQNAMQDSFQIHRLQQQIASSQDVLKGIFFEALAAVEADQGFLAFEDTSGYLSILFLFSEGSYWHLPKDVGLTGRVFTSGKPP